MKGKNRFVVYADFLGTKQRYATPRLVVRGRELLEQALAQYVVPMLNADDMNLYVFSDTAIVTCPQLNPLLKPISNLFAHFIQLVDDNEDRSLTLWLRAAISYGSVLQVDHLQNFDRIRTIPFLDTSLPTAYNLETVRKGSRVFVDPAIGDDELDKHTNLFLRWQQITGHGLYAKDVAEYLWPAVAYPGSSRLVETTMKLHGWWSNALSKKEWSRDEYYERLIHLDETVKLFIRTSTAFCSGEHKKELLLSLLPAKKGPHKNIRFLWGMWFQALKALAESYNANISDAQVVVTAFEIVQEILSKGGFLHHFLSELDFPDYAGFRRTLSQLGLYRSSD